MVQQSHSGMGMVRKNIPLHGLDEGDQLHESDQGKID